MRVALYARVSTADQRPDAQLDALRNYAVARGFDLINEYTDVGWSGARARRPALDQMMHDARRRKFDAVLVAKLDRLGRSLHDLLGLLGELDDLGVKFISVDDAIDTSTAAGRLFMQMRGAFAEYELSLIRERTAAGMQAARRRGKRLGRPRAIAGASRIKLERLMEEGSSIRGAARQLGCAESTVRRAVERLGLRSAGA